MGKEKSHAARLLLPAPQPNPALKRTRVVRWVFVVGFFPPAPLSSGVGQRNRQGVRGFGNWHGQRVIKGIALIENVIP